MKKSTFILILIVFIASIPIINFFGLNAKVYDEVVNVSAIECINNDDEYSTVSINKNNKKVIKVTYSDHSEKVKYDGVEYVAKLQLKYRVYPDNATTKSVEFVYDTTNEDIMFYKDEKGRENGLIFFKDETMFEVKIKSIDGKERYTSILIWCSKEAKEK